MAATSSPVAPEGDVDRGADVPCLQDRPGRLEPRDGEDVLDDERALLERPDRLRDHRQLPRQAGRARGVTRPQRRPRQDLDERRHDVAERRGEQLRGPRDQLVRGDLLSGQREHAGEQLQPHAVVVARGDVLEVALDVHRAAVRPRDDHLVVADPDHGAVPGHEAVRGRRLGPTAPVAGLDLTQHPRAVVGMQALDEELGVGEPFLARVAEQPLDLRADVERRAAVVERVDVDDDGELLDDRTEVDRVHRLYIGRIAPRLRDSSLGAVCRPPE